MRGASVLPTKRPRRLDGSSDRSRPDGRSRWSRHSRSSGSCNSNFSRARTRRKGWERITRSENRRLRGNRAMRYRALHGTDLQLSELGFGTWTVTTGWWGNYTDEEAQRIIRRAIDHGINYIDTADAYGNGRGETILAPVLKDHPELIVGTKFGYDFYN